MQVQRLGNKSATTTVTLFDPLGQVVKVGKLAQSTLVLDVSGLAAGIYVIELAEPDRVIRKKLLVTD